MATRHVLPWRRRAVRVLRLPMTMRVPQRFVHWCFCCCRGSMSCDGETGFIPPTKFSQPVISCASALCTLTMFKDADSPCSWLIYSQSSPAFIHLLSFVVAVELCVAFRCTLCLHLAQGSASCWSFVPLQWLPSSQWKIFCIIYKTLAWLRKASDKKKYICFKITACAQKMVKSTFTQASKRYMQLTFFSLKVKKNTKLI